MNHQESPHIKIQVMYSMKNVALPFGKKEDIVQSKKFVQFVVDHINKKSKLELIQAFTFTLGEILMLVCELQNDIKEWHHTWREFVTETYYELKKGWKKLKDPLVINIKKTNKNKQKLKFFFFFSSLGRYCNGNWSYVCWSKVFIGTTTYCSFG